MIIGDYMLTVMRDAAVQMADSALKKATLKRKLCEEQVEVLSCLCFTGTKVQILTQKALLSARGAPQSRRRAGDWEENNRAFVEHAMQAAPNTLEGQLGAE